MERPLSASSSGTAPSTTSGPGHRRNASSAKNGIKPAGPSTVSLFVANLRLLNLDLLPDWPNITVSSFSNLDTRMRIKCTEYALYQLFRLYDLATTADKLQPFFPPLEPLQSVNLRAALYRCLNELKKNGVLSKETVLRKTMLDECQGERFWEICLGFSTIVLRKVALKKKNKNDKPIAERISTAHGMDQTQKESMLPLAIAHRASLTKVLEEKRKKREIYAGLYDLLAQKEAELRQRKIRSQEHAEKAKQLRPEKLKTVEQAIEKSWVGSTELKDALVNGDTCPKGDGMLLQSFDKLWRSDEDTRSVSSGAEVGLLQSLDEKTTEQHARLRRWQHFHDHLLASKRASARSSRPITAPHKAAIKFDRHRNLTLSDSPNEQVKQPQQRRVRHTSASRYDEILTAMREELRKNSTHRARSETVRPSTQPLKHAQTQPVPLRRLSVAVDASPGARDPHARSPSQTAVPVRPPAGRRVSSRSRSYQQPKVISQRERIPLKSELFSPLKDKRTSPGSSMLSSPAEEAEAPVVAVDGVDWAVSKDSKRDQEKVGSPQRDSKLDIQITDLESASGPNTASITSFESVRPESDQMTMEVEFKMPALPAKNAQHLITTSRPSLAERTSKSVAFNSTENINGFLPDAPSVATKDSETVAECVESTEPFNRRASLLERTRQSISMAPPTSQAPRSKKSPSHNRSRTSVYPINQFDTPQKARGTRRSTMNGAENEPQRVFTPMEKLLSPEAEYDSVFKSRPKIALSPVISPYRDAERLSISSEGGVLDSEVGRSSPLVR